MSTKQQTNSSQTQAYQFDPQSLARYQQSQGQAMQGFQQFAGNPFQNPFFNATMGMQSRQANQMGQTGLQNLLLNQSQMAQRGVNMPAFMMAQQAQQGRQSQGLQSQGLMGTLQNFQGLQQNALSALMSGFNPLNTGQTGSSQSTQTQSGLGTWLPQLIGTAAGAAMGGMGGGGGLSSLFKGAAKPTTMGNLGSNGFGGFASGTNMLSGFGQSGMGRY